MNPWLQSSRGIPQPQGFGFARHYLARNVTDTKPLTAAKCAKLSSHSSNGSSTPSFPCGNHHQEGHPNPCTLQFPIDITAKTDHLLRCPAPAPCTGILDAQYMLVESTHTPHWKCTSLPSNTSLKKVHLCQAIRQRSWPSECVMCGYRVALGGKPHVKYL